MATRYTPDWAAGFEYRLRERFPHDLAGQAVYIVTSQEVGPNFEGHPEVLAYYDRLIDLKMRQPLQCAGIWQGPGFATFINNQGTFNSISDEDQWGVILHEFGHWLDWRSEEPVELASRPEFAGFIANVLAPQKREGDHVPRSLTLPPWHQHELRFHRAVLHVADRAGLTDLAPMQVFERYGLSSPDEYRAAFAGEFGTTLRVRDILDLPVPQAAADLFAADQARWKPDTQPAAVAT